MVESLFPCYLFVRCNVELKADDIRYVSGMSSLVRFGDKIAVVPDGVIEELAGILPKQRAVGGGGSIE